MAQHFSFTLNVKMPIGSLTLTRASSGPTTNLHHKLNSLLQVPALSLPSQPPPGTALPPLRTPSAPPCRDLTLPLDRPVQHIRVCRSVKQSTSSPLLR
eukprot:1187046-Prorocentrum_minimum.AAC.1